MISKIFKNAASRVKAGVVLSVSIGLISLIFSPLARAQSPGATLSIPAVTGAPDSTATVSVMLATNPSPQASVVSFELSYDASRLKYTSFLEGMDLYLAGINKYVEVVELVPGTITLLVAEMNDPSTGAIPSGEIFKVKFNILPTAPAGDAFLNFSNVNLLDKNSLNINTTLQNSNITVIAANAVPVANNQDIALDEDNAYDITLSASDADAGDVLTYQVVTQPGHGSLTGTAPNLTYAPEADYNGTDSFTFKANDGKVDSNTATVSLTVNSVNDAPVLGAIADITVNEGETIGITPQAIDADNDVLTYVYSGWMTTNSYVADYDDAGTHTVTITVSDASLSDTRDVTITVNNINRPPVLDPIAPIIVDEGQIITITPSATDLDGDGLTYIYSGWKTSLPYTATYDDSGSHTIRVTAADPDGLSDYQDVAITVIDVDQTPPAIPQGLSANAVSSMEAGLSWDANSEEDLSGYKIYRNSILLTSLDKAQVSYTDTGLIPDMTYNYTVSAFDVSGNESASSTEASVTTLAGMQRLKVSPNNRFLVKEDGTPFFWMGDTAWSILTISPADVDLYLNDRVEKGFNLIHIDADAYGANNYNGQRPFINNNTDTPNEAWWSYLDSIITKAENKGIYVCLFTMWSEVRDGTLRFGGYRLFNGDTAKARRFGNWIGNRYKSRANTIWSVSGEFDKLTGTGSTAIFEAMAEGLEEAHGGSQLMTIHPAAMSYFSSSGKFHNSPWLDFNMLQTSHLADARPNEPYAVIAGDYTLTPVKPAVEGEPTYEGTVDWKTKLENGPSVVRRKVYWAVFAGSPGVTYGHMSVQKMNNPLETANIPWKEALNSPGAQQIKYLRALMESFPNYLNRIPDQSIIVSPNNNGIYYIQATRDAGGAYALVYIPDGAPVTVNMAKIANGNVNASWYNPRTGAYTLIGNFPNSGPRTFDAPGASAEGNDWVLVLTNQAGPVTQCTDGLDNDGDGKIDFGDTVNNDCGCSSSNDDNEADGPTLDTGLTGYWKLDEPVGSTAISDSSENNINGTNNGVVCGETGMVGKACLFNGSTGGDNYILVNDPGTASPLDFATGNQITVSTWVKPYSFVSNSGYTTILGKDKNYGIQACKISSSTAALVFYFRDSANTKWVEYKTSDFIQLSVPSHIAVTYTFGDATSIQFYVNGARKQGAWVSGTGNESPFISNVALKIGNTPNEEWNGLIDDVRIYGRLLHISEIDKLAKPNSAPIANAQSVTLDAGGTKVIALTATDTENDPLTYTIVTQPANGMLSGTAPDLTYAPQAGYSGTDSFTFKANDGQADSNEATVSITINQLNISPVFNQITAKEGNENAQLGFKVLATDADGDVLDYSAANLPEGATFGYSCGPGRLFSWKPASNQGSPQGTTYIVTFIASDGKSEVSQDVTITVYERNNPPVLNVYGARTVKAGNTIWIRAEAKDLDNTPLQYTVNPLPQNASFYDSRQGYWVLRWAPTPEQAGVYSLSFEVTDGELSDKEDITLTVYGDNHAPSIWVQDEASGRVGREISFYVSGWDRDLDPVTLSAVNLPQGASFNLSNNRKFIWTPAAVQGGDYVVTFTVRDPAGLEVSKDITISVKETNNAPVFVTLVSDWIVQPGRLMEIYVVAEDADSDDLTYGVANAPNGASASYGECDGRYRFAWKPTSTDIGEHADIYFYVSDGDLTVETNRITLTVAP